MPDAQWSAEAQDWIYKGATTHSGSSSPTSSAGTGSSAREQAELDGELNGAFSLEEPQLVDQPSRSPIPSPPRKDHPANETFGLGEDCRNLELELSQWMKATADPKKN
jgi:hypothetical protein